MHKEIKIMKNLIKDVSKPIKLQKVQEEQEQ